jgi:hypothetical protein
MAMMRITSLPAWPGREGRADREWRLEKGKRRLETLASRAASILNLEPGCDIIMQQGVTYEAQVCSECGEGFWIANRPQ